MGRNCLTGTGFPFGMMKMFWNYTGIMVINHCEGHLKKKKNFYVPVGYWNHSRLFQSIQNNISSLLLDCPAFQFLSCWHKRWWFKKLWLLFFQKTFYWSTVYLQGCISFCCSAKWISYTYICIHSFLRFCLRVITE